ncbi:hypothetical protein MRB53_022415 [Persea americana]|uniref:Uncharacterized protein n=1 Tax=Persea americana TaxID=3435 RepID=A0ACC2L6X6_PERAE|nr:hypothetical protein MRB53_022415 [Persea americana]
MERPSNPASDDTRSEALAQEHDSKLGRRKGPSTLPASKLVRRCTVPPLGEQPADHEGAVNVGERYRGGATRRAVERLGVFEAGGCYGSSMESGVLWWWRQRFWC